MAEEDRTEKILQGRVDYYTDQLKKFKSGDPLAIPLTARLIQAVEELKDYQKSKKK